MRELFDHLTRYDYLIPKIVLGGLWLAGIVADYRADRPAWVLVDTLVPPVGIYRGIDHILTRNPY